MQQVSYHSDVAVIFKNSKQKSFQSSDQRPPEGKPINAGIKVLRRYDGFPSIAASLRRISVNYRVLPVLNVLNSLFIILRP